ncbi:MAG: AbrB/MazE/SpoVT family DNA-binding domain-containing protein [Lachnospiraceae bacterium]|nr:AbrB/MazE/SpoVT family DNA-binding domain-containing protein [Lachnospiraceae bacterium]
MKATGIVRRIDDLGRIVVPKEIRRVLRIREGDSMEIFTDIEGEIILKKYSPIGELGNVAEQYAESISQITGRITIITDKDSVIAIAGSPKKTIKGKKISKRLEGILVNREVVRGDSTRIINIVDNESIDQGEQVICPIVSDGDVIGGVIIAVKLGDKGITEVEEKVAIMASNFLGKRMEV